jgi:putative endonuclease
MIQCWWLYLLVCRYGRTYAGIATDVAVRFAAHSSGKGAKFTR